MVALRLVAGGVVAGPPPSCLGCLPRSCLFSSRNDPAAWSLLRQQLFRKLGFAWRQNALFILLSATSKPTTGSSGCWLSLLACYVLEFTKWLVGLGIFSRTGDGITVSTGLISEKNIDLWQ
jgi:hypothetical protein